MLNQVSLGVRSRRKPNFHKRQATRIADSIAAAGPKANINPDDGSPTREPGPAMGTAQAAPSNPPTGLIGIPTPPALGPILTEKASTIARHKLKKLPVSHGNPLIL